MASDFANDVTDWLLSGLKLKSTVFHVGQYCGTWQASTSGRRLASFHIVLYGQCWLHIAPAPGRAAESIRLESGDAAFLLRDIAHCLSPSPVPPPPGGETARIGAMSPLDPKEADSPAPKGVGIACGFFEFASTLDGLLIHLLPDRIIARDGHSSLAGARTVFGLIRDEALRGAVSPSPLLARLTSLLFIYTLRTVNHDAHALPSSWRLLGDSAFAPLASAIVESPAQRWTTQRMADFAHMSRSRFCLRFSELSGQSPAQFLALVRMKLAATMLTGGASTAQVAERVGYQSESAFAQAFRRITGIAPGSCRRARTLSEHR